MGTRLLNAVREACSLDASKRGEDHIDDVLAFVKDVKFFSKLNILQQRALCRTMTIETFAPREYVFQKDEYGHKFYMILTGSVAVQIPSQSAACPRHIHPIGKCDCPDRPLETLVFLDKGMGFGELALQSNAPRSATIQTSELTELLVTTKDDYDCHAGQLHRQFIEQRVQFLRRCPNVELALKHQLFTEADIIAMANCLTEQSFSGHAILCQQGDPAHSVIFLRKGSLSALRTLEVDSAGRLVNGNTPTAAQASKEDALGGTPGAADGAKTEKSWTQAVIEMKRQERENKRSSLLLDAQARGNNQASASDASNKQDDSDDEDDSDDSDDDAASGTASAAASTVASSKDGKAGWKKVQAITSGWAAAKIFKSNKLDALKDKPAEPEPKKATFDSVAPNGNIASATNQAAKNMAQFRDVHNARLQYAKFEVKRMAKEREAKRASLQQRSQKAMIQMKEDLRQRNARANDQKNQRQQVLEARRETVVFQPTAEGNLNFAMMTSQQHFGLNKGGKGAGARLPPLRGLAGEVSRPVSSEVKREILHVGVIGAYQYYGDQQVLSNSTYPVTLMSDPLADVYVMSKNDIMRRLPKKIIMSFFQGDSFVIPSDNHLLERIRQTERWNSTKRDIWADVINSKKAKVQVNGAPRTFRDPAGTSYDIRGNLEFLGRSDILANLDAIEQQDEKGESEFGERSLTRPPTGRLTGPDMEYYSESSASFLGRLRTLDRDPCLVRHAKAQGGRVRDSCQGQFGWLASGPTVKINNMDGELLDPYATKTDKFWSKLRKDPFEIDMSGFDFGFDTLIRPDRVRLAASPEGISGGEPLQEVRRKSSALSGEQRKPSVSADVVKKGLAKRRQSRAGPALEVEEAQGGSVRQTASGLPAICSEG